MDDLSFLLDPPRYDADAVLLVLLPDSTVVRIEDISPYMILDQCPLLYHAFEYGAQGVRQANIEAPSKRIVVSFVRFLYTGNHVPADSQCTLLEHAQIYKMADDFDVPELQVAAYVQFMTETEISCSLPSPPPTLCETIRFIYEHSSSQQCQQQQSLVETLLNYCVFSFKYHGLGERSDFRQVVFDIPPFQKALCQTSLKRDFQDDGACDIMRLPVSSPSPRPDSALCKRALGDFQFEFWCDAEEPSSDANSTHAQDNTKRRKSDAAGGYTMVYRPKNPQQMPSFSESESSSDEEGFTLVHRPKISVNTNAVYEYRPSDPSSSPGFDPATTVDVHPSSVTETLADPFTKDNLSPVPADDSDWSLI